MIPLDFGTVPQWLTGCGVLTFVGVFLKHDLGRRQIRQTNDADIRDHYADELDRVVERQHACEEREQSLRERVTELENDVLGLISIIRQASTDKVLQMGDLPDNIHSMVDRLQKRGQ
jgi:hypothetical protein